MTNNDRTLTTKPTCPVCAQTARSVFAGWLMPPPDMRRYYSGCYCTACGSTWEETHNNDGSIDVTGLRGRAMHGGVSE